MVIVMSPSLYNSVGDICHGGGGDTIASTPKVHQVGARTRAIWAGPSWLSHDPIMGGLGS